MPVPSQKPLTPAAELIPSAPTAPPTATAAPEAHQEPTQTSEQPAPETGESGPRSRAADLSSPPHGHILTPRPSLSRRRALLALTGTTLTAATALTTWKLLDDGPTGPGEQLWALPTGGWVESSPTVADGVVYVGSGDNLNDNNLYAVQT
ncbi:PQQ-binding-like beta-propeller repeat protein [Streptomyces sp. NPDC053474]|uniref:PQQ-binding-like beta-propeller repeat protein n=1 Tax=Streptomyces sp. NPDC053474 TaxID=3365704 RepID=UPI0037D2E3E8